MPKKARKKLSEVDDKYVESVENSLGDIPLSLLVGMRLEGLTLQEIADKCGHSKNWASKRLKNWSLNRIDYFKKYRADIFAGVSERLIDLIEKKISSDQVIEGIKDLTGALVKLYDRERIERGLSTSIRSYKELDDKEQALIAEEKRLRKELEESGKVKRIK